MLRATQAFLEPLEKWIKAVRENDYVAAKQHAEHLCTAGELLVIRGSGARRRRGRHAGEAKFHISEV